MFWCRKASVYSTFSGVCPFFSCRFQMSTIVYHKYIWDLDLGFLKIWKLSLSYLLKVSCLLPIRHRLKVCKLFTFKEMQVMVMNIFPKHFLCKFTLFKQSCRFPLFTMSRLPYVRANAGLVSKNLPVCIKIVILVKYSYLVGMSRWENLCIPESWFGWIPN